jgi:hypothetical protein
VIGEKGLGIGDCWGIANQRRIVGVDDTQFGAYCTKQIDFENYAVHSTRGTTSPHLLSFGRLRSASRWQQEERRLQRSEKSGKRLVEPRKLVESHPRHPHFPSSTDLPHTQTTLLDSLAYKACPALSSAFALLGEAMSKSLAKAWRQCNAHFVYLLEHLDHP